MSASLVYALPGQPEATAPLKASFSIGRGSANDLVIKDAQASRGHAMIRALGRGSWFILDLGSANGTFVNGRLLTAPVELQDGDRIRIAEQEFVFRQSGGKTQSGSDDEYDTSGQETLVNVKTEAISILVADVRGFTHLSEALPAKELSSLIGSWFRDAGVAIERHGGVIDKFIGDAVMCYWMGTGEAYGPRLIHGPLNAALELMKLASFYNDHLAATRPELKFEIGCGVHMGQAVFGNIGQSARRDFTAIGDCVNVAFRLESLTKELKRPVLTSEDMKSAASGAFAFEDLGQQKLKGRDQAMRVYALTASRGA